MTALHVWANCADVPIRVCADARLRDRRGRPFELHHLWDDPGPLISRTDQTYGQAGWDVGVEFSSLERLADRLEHLTMPSYVTPRARPVRRGELRRLAINAHGNSGEVLVAGHLRPADALKVENLRRYHPYLTRIGLLTPSDGTGIIYLMGCLAGLGLKGTELLVRLSRLWPNRRVVGFVSIGYAAGGAMGRSGENCTDPGMRDTGLPFSAGQASEQLWGSQWSDLSELPWASETSRSAKVALNGQLIRGQQFDADPEPTSPRPVGP